MIKLMVKDPLEIMDEDDEDDPTSNFVNVKKGNANASENDSENPDKSDDAGKVGATRSRGNLIFLHRLKITICTYDWSDFEKTNLFLSLGKRLSQLESLYHIDVSNSYFEIL